MPVPDPRVERLAELAGLERVIHATIEFVDIAGLVRGASKGEGLGNQFLSNIRDADAIVHVIRCFDDPNVVHISDKPSPQEDIEIVEMELVLADIQQLERKIERLGRQVKGDRKLRPVLELAERLLSHLNTGQPASRFPQRADGAFQALNHDLRLLSSKPAIYAANVDEEGLSEENEYVLATRRIAAEKGIEVVEFCARLEEDMVGMSDSEQREYLLLAGAEESGLEQIIRKGYRMLDLISFFSMNEEETRAWTIRDGWTAPQAAGVIHTDFERGFIRAEVIPFEIFEQYASSAAAKAAGAVRVEGKEYIVADGDVIYFRFNV